MQSFNYQGISDHAVCLKPEPQKPLKWEACVSSLLGAGGGGGGGGDREELSQAAASAAVQSQPDPQRSQESRWHTEPPHVTLRHGLVFGCEPPTRGDTATK